MAASHKEKQEGISKAIHAAHPHPFGMARAIKRLLENELSRGEHFFNYHGITRENLPSALVEPFLVRVDPDDQETLPRAMWIVLQERRKPTEG